MEGAGQGLAVQEWLFLQAWRAFFARRAEGLDCTAQWLALTKMYASPCPTSMPVLHAWPRVRAALLESPLKLLVEMLETFSPEFGFGRHLLRSVTEQPPSPVAVVSALRALASARAALAAWISALLHMPRGADAPLSAECAFRGEHNHAALGCGWPVLHAGKGFWKELRACWEAARRDAALMRRLRDASQQQGAGGAGQISMAAEGHFYWRCRRLAEMSSREDARLLADAFGYTAEKLVDVMERKGSPMEYGRRVELLEEFPLNSLGLDVSDAETALPSADALSSSGESI